MADEIDEILTPEPELVPGSQPTPEPGTEEEKTTTIDKDELARLIRSADEVDTLKTQLSGLTSQLETFRQQPQAQPQHQEPAEAITSDQLFANPTKAIRDTVQREFMPAARQFASQIAGISIESFKARKESDDLYSGVSPIFDKKIKSISPEYLGGLSASVLTDSLKEAWNASVGEYVLEERKKRASAKPKNLSGGGNAGAGTTKKKTLAEVDPIAFKIAIEGGMSAEDMQAIADGIEE